MRSRQELKKLYHSLEFKEKYFYKENNLGAVCTEEGTSFLLWSPLAEKVCLCFYEDGEKAPCCQTVSMKKEEKGVWAYRTEEDLHGLYYDYEITFDGEKTVTGDPYAKACGINGIRSMVCNMKKTDPTDWDKDKRPQAPSENVIYELHVKEFSWEESGGFKKENRGKYLAFTEEHTTLYGDGEHPTGLDYMKELGVTHVQLMPVYDYGSVDEKEATDFNWGYDPVNYNVPEGSYSTDPKHGEVRILEFKKMVQALHRNGFRVIMDVVYNHMFSLDTCLNRTVPWYYFRTEKNGKISNGSACGNDMASERSMCAKYILDSVLYWVREYHIDGFRFDLMGLLDVELMNRIRKELDNIYGEGEILIYGEPWAADKTAMEDGAIPALKSNVRLLNKNVGMFCDDTRDAIKGHVFEAETPGFINGAEGLEDKILDSVTAWCGKDRVKAPSQIITYVSAHDNWTLWDKLSKTVSDEKKRERINRLAAAVYMTCQGNIFFLSGEEFARTKDGHENTYNASIELNCLKWEQAYKYQELRQYYQGLIALRKQLPGLCDKSEEAWKRVSGQWKEAGAVGFFVDNRDKGQTSPWKKLMIIYNRTEKTVKRKLPEGKWEILLNGENSFLWKEKKNIQRAEAAPVSALILGQR